MDSEKVFRAWGLPDDFLDRNWRRAHATGRVVDPADVPGGLTEDEIGELLGQGLRADRVSVSTRGRLHHPAEFTTARTIAGRPVADVVDPEQVHRLLDSGATAVLANAELWVPRATRLAEVLAEDFGCEVQAHVFLTGAGHAGLVPHADGEDNFLVQLAGSKTWSVWEHDGVGAQRIDASALGDPTAVVTLTPGDVLYIPVGWVHAATAGEGGSTHITYQVVPESLVDAVLDQLGDELEEVLGDRLKPAPGDDPLPAEQVTALVRDLVELLDRRAEGNG
ncbi:JmjC domain-containing protein [Actinosynnema sp. NPDC091369]